MLTGCKFTKNFKVNVQYKVILYIVLQHRIIMVSERHSYRQVLVRVKCFRGENASRLL